jgi:hypothetical protein
MDKKMNTPMRRQPVWRRGLSIEEPGVTIVRNGGRSPDIRPLRIMLWILGVAVGAVLWVWLLDTSYDWISSTDDLKVIMGFLILISMAGALVALFVKGARWLWQR